MNHRPLLPLVLTAVLLLSTGLACQFLAGGQPAPTPEVISQPVQVVTEVPPPTPVPVQPLEEPTPVPPTEAQSVQFFTEEFDSEATGWTPFVTHGNLSQMELSTRESRLTFDLKERQLWAYLLYEPQAYNDVRIDVSAENRGENQNNISLICRYDKERGWYEFNVANSGLYSILFGRWDNSGTTASYANIADGGSNNIHQGLAVNTYGMVCKGNTIVVYINDKEIKRVDDKRGLRDGQIAIGVSSFTRLPVEVEFDWVRISEP